MPTFGSLFAGIGGMDLGLERAGWECRWQVEVDEFCQRVLAKHWPSVPRYGDIHEVRELQRVDLVCGGFPCQPVSLAGKGKAQDDERWLWPEFHRIIRMVRPRLVLVENVPGLLGRGFGDVLGDLAQSGYDTEWDCIPAAAVGANHLRSRVWIVAYPRGSGAGVEEHRGSRSGGKPASALQPKVLRQGNGTGRSEGVGADRPNVENANGRDAQSRQGRVGLRQASHCVGQHDHPGRSGESRLFGFASEWWASEPEVGRLVDGLSDGLARARLAALGNAVVPQVAEWIGRRLLDVA